MGRHKMVTIAGCALVKGYAITVVDAISARNVEGVKNEANGTEAEKHAVALPYFPTDNSSSLDVGHFLQTMDASGVMKFRVW